MNTEIAVWAVDDIASPERSPNGCTRANLVEALSSTPARSCGHGRCARSSGARETEHERRGADPDLQAEFAAIAADAAVRFELGRRAT